MQVKEKLDYETVILATAHPAKFPKTINEAGLNITNIPSSLSSIIDKEEVAIKLSASDNLIFEYIKQNN